MRTKTLKQTITFKASPRQVYDMIMDSKKHQSLSGEKAKISQRVGGKFTAWGSHLSGINLVLKPGKKIVQAWRATGWWPDHYSIAIFDITKVKSGARCYERVAAKGTCLCCPLAEFPDGGMAQRLRQSGQQSRAFAGRLKGAMCLRRESRAAG